MPAFMAVNLYTFHTTEPDSVWFLYKKSQLLSKKLLTIAKVSNIIKVSIKVIKETKAKVYFLAYLSKLCSYNSIDFKACQEYLANFSNLF